MIWDQMVKENPATALSIAVVRNYQIVDRITVGAEITVHTRFQAASISKEIFALAVLRLVEEGKLGLDEDVNQYFQEYRVPKRDGTLAKLTVRQILSHTAGLTVSGFDGYEAGAGIPNTLQIIQGEPPCNSSKVVQEFSAGLKWQYSGGGYMVLQRCVEEVTGMEFSAFMKEYVLDPLEMTDSTYRQDITENLAFGYGFWDEDFQVGHRIMPEQAAAGLWTTASDLAKYGIHVQNILRGRSGLISRRTAEEMIRPQHNDLLNMEGTLCQTGLGCYLKTIHGQKYFGHSGENLGFVSLMNFSIQDGNGVCTLINFNEGRKLLCPIQEEYLP